MSQRVAGALSDDIAKWKTGGGKPVHSIHTKGIHVHFAGSTLSIRNAITDHFMPLLKYGTGDKYEPKQKQTKQQTTMFYFLCKQWKFVIPAR